MLLIALQIVLLTLVGLLTALTIVPFVKFPHGLVRGPDFARLQILVTALISVPLAVALLNGATQALALLCLAGIVIVNGIAVLKFTPVWPKQSVSADPSLLQQTDRHLSVLTANVKMSNRDYGAVIDLARDEKPDVLALIEPDADWIEAMATLRAQFRHHVEHPLKTGYGLALYSNLPLSDTDVRDKVTDGVPSITTTVTLPCGNDIRLFIVHPEPPTASDPTTGRDSEIALAGLEAIKGDLPAVIAGDLNDVAWSHTTRRFQRITGLLDPRVGRGFFNTFNAFYPVFRWPLDHLFHDPAFRLVTMGRLRKINSDHFPMSFTLALAQTPAGDTPAPKPDEKQAVEAMIHTEKSIDRDPIGTDWEQDEDNGAKG